MPTLTVTLTAGEVAEILARHIEAQMQASVDVNTTTFEVREPRNSLDQVTGSPTLLSASLRVEMPLRPEAGVPGPYRHERAQGR